jgi:hypothetical protein
LRWTLSNAQDSVALLTNIPRVGACPIPDHRYDHADTYAV